MRARTTPDHTQSPAALPTEQAWSRLDLAILAALVVVTGVVSIIGLGSKELWLDEVDTWYVVSGDFSQMLSVIWDWDLHSGPYFVGMWLWTRISDGAAWMRLPSVLWALATVPLVASLGRRLFDRRVGLVAALLVSTSGALLPHAQEARSYTLVMALAAACSILFLRAERDRTTRAWLWYALGCIALVTVHLFGVLVVAGHVAWLLMTRPDRVRPPDRGAVIAAVILTLVTAPLALLVLGQNSGYTGEWVGEPWELGTYLQVADFWSGGARASTFVILVPFATVAWLTARSLVATSIDRPAPEWFVVLGVAVPSAALALASFGPNLFLSRYLIVCVPCFVILVARGLDLLPRFVAVPILLIVVVASLDSARSWLQAESIDPFEALTAHLVENLRPDDRIAFLDNYDRLGVLYNTRDLSPDLIPPLVTSEPLQTPAWRGPIEIADPMEEARQGRLWVVVHAYQGEIIDQHQSDLDQWREQGLEPQSVTRFRSRALIEFDEIDP